RSLGDRAAAWRAVALFGVTGWVVLLFVDPWLVDAPTMFLSMLTFLLVRRGHLGWASVTASAAVASHETALVMLIPLAVAHYFERGRKVDVRLISFVSIPILVYLLIRSTPLIYGRVPPSALFRNLEYLRGQFDTRLRLDGGIGNAMLFTISASFGATWV